jgi:ParB family chromosome partitioning protein
MSPNLRDGSWTAIDAIQIGRRFRKDLGDLDALAASIKDVGLLHPIVITPDRHLIAGQRRLAACKRLGWPDVPTTVVDLDQIILGEFAENEYRKDLTLTEKAAIIEALRPKLEAAAKKR